MAESDSNDPVPSPILDRLASIHHEAADRAPGSDPPGAALARTAEELERLASQLRERGKAMPPEEMDRLFAQIANLRAQLRNPAGESTRMRAEKEAEYAENGRMLARHLLAKWGSERLCPFCQTNNWLIDPSPIAMARAELPGAAIPAFLVMCQNCGFEAHVSAERAGVYEVDRGAIKRAKERSEE